MSILISSFFWILITTGCKNKDSATDQLQPPILIDTTYLTLNEYNTDIITGAEQTELYFPLIKNKYVACIVNQTSVIGKVHLVDSLLNSGINIQTIFAPEHGFRGTEDAGATILNSKDVKSGLPVISLYGNKKKPSQQDIADAEIIIFDIQDVGARFYTYISTLHYVMEACAENNKKLIILDRPNPNGFYVDGPVLQKEFTSFVGMHPVPVVHGMTIGEYAQMINGEKWLTDSSICDLTVIPCKNYDHAKYYEVKIPPSPNLKSMKAIYLYPSLCLFEGTNVSVGRGTNKPFEIFGSPFLPIDEDIMDDRAVSFIPRSLPGSKVPPFMNQECYGYDFSEFSLTYLRNNIINSKLHIEYLLITHELFTEKNKFFLESNFFNKLAGNSELMEQVNAGLTDDEIQLSWQDDIIAFKKIRKKYLIYPDFE